MIINAEYIWLDGTKPLAGLRSKTRVLELGDFALNLNNYPVWSYDGSSTYQAQGRSSDLNLKPVRIMKDPIRDCEQAINVLVLCEVLLPNNMPHETNTRHQLAQELKIHHTLPETLSFEQRYTLNSNVPSVQVQVTEQHLKFCLQSGLPINGIANGVFHIGYRDIVNEKIKVIEVCDDLILARWIMSRMTEEHDIEINYTNTYAISDNKIYHKNADPYLSVLELLKQWIKYNKFAEVI